MRRQQGLHQSEHQQKQSRFTCDRWVTVASEEQWEGSWVFSSSSLFLLLVLAEALSFSSLAGLLQRETFFLPDGSSWSGLFSWRRQEEVGQN